MRRCPCIALLFCVSYIVFQPFLIISQDEYLKSYATYCNVYVTKSAAHPVFFRVIGYGLSINILHKLSRGSFNVSPTLYIVSNS